MSADTDTTAIDAIARAIANGQGCNFDSLYPGPKLQVLRDARSAHRAMTEQAGHISVQTYEDFVVTRRQALVIQAPDITCMAVELLRSIDSARIVGDRIHVGEDEQGEPVTYQITGWDAARTALVLKRIRH